MLETLRQELYTGKIEKGLIFVVHFLKHFRNYQSRTPYIIIFQELWWRRSAHRVRRCWPLFTVKVTSCFHRRTIHTMEHALYSQVFRKMGVQPKLEMYYPFAASYEVDELVEKCEEILKEELKEHDTIEHMKFCSHPFEVDGNSIVLTCDDDFCVMKKVRKLKNFYPND